MQKVKFVFIGTLLAIVGSLTVFSHTYATPLQWPVRTDGLEARPGGFTANASDNISLINCSSNSTTHPNLFEHFGDTYPATITSNIPSKFPCIGTSDTYGQIQTTADGTFYTHQITLVNGQPEDRIAAVRNNKVLWSTSITSNDTCGNGNRSAPYSISIGPNGNIYTIISSHVISDCATYIAGFDGKTGAQIFKQYLDNRIPPNSSRTSWAFAGRLWTYDDKILLVDTNGMEREFSYSGVEDIAARYQFPNIPNTGAYGGALHANHDGRVFVVYRTAWGCYPNVDGTYIRYHDTDGTSGTSSLNLGCTPDYSYKPTHDGSLAAYGYSGNVLVAHMTGNNHSINTFPVPQGYNQARVLNYWEDTSGNGVLVRQLTDANGLRTIAVDDVDISNGTLTNIASIDPNIVGYNFGNTTRRIGDINSGYLYLPLCHTSCNSSADRADNSWVHRIQLPNFGTPIKDTNQLTDTTGSDVDIDGLTLAQEVSQGTSDHDTDTDKDGLSDYVESIWNTNRSTSFCGTTECAYPEPTKKDLHVEIDWMDDGTNEYKPSGIQVELIKDAFENNGVNLHVDTGQYGGGNELPVYIEALKFEPISNETDFFNLKNGDNTYSMNFAEDRRGIWHYMVTGDKYYDGGSNTTSGVAYPGDDDAFIALGQVAQDHPSTQDQAIAGTVIHELGHNLCLSNTTYTGQDPSCLFSGVDTYASSDYNSSMNYNKQFSLVDYSDGSNGSNDHNDWAAVLIGMDDFVTLGEDPVEPSLGAKVAFDKEPIYEKTSTEELHKAAERQAQIEKTKNNSEEEQDRQNAQSNHEPQDRNTSAKNGNEIEVKQNSDSQPEWIPLLLGSGVVLLIAAAGTVWYLRSKQK